MFCREFLRYNLIPISNIHSDDLIIRSSKILKRLKSGINLYFDNLLLEASNNYDYYCSFFSNCKLKFSLEAILEEILLRATNFHSPTSAIDGSREGKDVENVGDRGTDPVNRIVHLKISWKQRLENETGKEGVELFSVFVDPRVFVGDFQLLKRWTHSSLAYLFENRHLEIFVGRNRMMSLRGLRFSFFPDFCLCQN